MSSLIKEKNLNNKTYKKPSLRRVNEPLYNFWSVYSKKILEFNVSLSDDLTCKIVPYYGLLTHDFDILGDVYQVDLDFDSDLPLTIILPKTFLNILLDKFLDPLETNHFDDEFVCSILEVVLADILRIISEKTGIKPKFKPATSNQGNFKSQWRIYVNDNQTPYPIFVIGEERIIKIFLDLLFGSAREKVNYEPLLPLTVISFARKISINKLQNLKLGEIIVVMTKRHPINEPLVLVGNDIVLHTSLNEMTLELLQKPTLSRYVEEIHMTNENDDMNIVQASTESQNELDTVLNDYKVSVLFELNRLDMPVKAISQLTQGSVINLQKPITEEIFITVAGRTIAVGEVVQIGQNFGVLIKEVFNG